MPHRPHLLIALAAAAILPARAAEPTTWCGDYRPQDRSCAFVRVVEARGQDTALVRQVHLASLPGHGRLKLVFSVLAQMDGDRLCYRVTRDALSEGLALYRAHDAGADLGPADRRLPEHEAAQILAARRADRDADGRLHCWSQSDPSLTRQPATAAPLMLRG